MATSFDVDTRTPLGDPGPTQGAGGCCTRFPRWVWVIGSAAVVVTLSIVGASAGDFFKSSTGNPAGNGGPGGGGAPVPTPVMYLCTSEQTSEGCTKCANATVCTNCTAGYDFRIRMIDNSVQVTTCGFVCTALQSGAGCTECSGPGKNQCTRCAEDEEPRDGRCDAVCNDQQHSTGCVLCENMDTCQRCKDGMQLKDNMCTAGCTTEQSSRRCTHCMNSTNCTNCESGYMRLDSGICVHRCVFNRENDFDPGVSHLPPKVRNGFEYPAMCVDESVAHFFGLGDWGGAWDAALTRDDGWVSGSRGAAADHTMRDGRLLYTYNQNGMDRRAQKAIAQLMHSNAETRKPRFVINVGDSFYFGGFEELGCGGDPSRGWDALRWKRVFEDMYNITHPVDPKRQVPWFSVLGNHDLGGQHFDSGWDHQIYYTYNPKNKRWRQPGMYWSQLVNFRHFSLELFMLDGNFAFAMNIKICQMEKAPAHGKCKLNSETPMDELNKGSCPHWFRKIWQESMAWVDKKIAKSTADYTAIVTHYPENCMDPRLRETMKKWGVDFCIAGHQHHELMYQRGDGCNAGNPCDVPLEIVTGGGGGISGESMATQGNQMYGYVDFEMTRDKFTAKIINAWGHQKSTWTLKRRKKQALGEGHS